MLLSDLEKQRIRLVNDSGLLQQQSFDVPNINFEI
jgi:hypothetical protein